MENYRGKGVSTTKFTKTGEPKHAGNFSYSTIHRQSLQAHDYPVRLIDNRLIVGNSTPLDTLMGSVVELAAREDGYFEEYQQKGEKTIGTKKYEAHKRLTKCHFRYQYLYELQQFTYREMIYTDGDFDYHFPEY